MTRVKYIRYQIIKKLSAYLPSLQWWKLVHLGYAVVLFCRSIHRNTSTAAQYYVF